MIPEIDSRLPGAETNIFTTMSRLAQECQAINLSQGFPDFPADPQLLDLLSEAMHKGLNQYAPMTGVPILRERIAGMVEATYGRNTNPETEVTVTSGGTEALYVSISAFVKTGDEVIIFDPSFDTYDPAVRLSGGIPVRINLRPPSFQIPWDEVERRVTSRTRMIVVNTPHNPCGTVLSADDLHNLERLCLRYGILLLSDEVYERIIFDGLTHHSALSRPSLADHAISVFSFGKMFHVTGWKTGYVVASPRLTQEIRKIHQFLIFSSNTPVQYAFAAFMEDAGHYTGLGEFYRKKRDFFRAQLEGTPFKPLACEGSYFQLVSYEAYSGEPDHELAVRLTREHKLATIPVSVFYGDRSDHRLLRICFAKQDKTLAAACEILKGLKQSE